VREPLLLSQIEPEYTDAARKARAMGRVTLRGIVQTNGIMTDIQIVEGLGFGLDENAIAAVQQWRFRPGMRNSEPVSMYISVTLTFSLR
jgi:protein TonB